MTGTLCGKIDRLPVRAGDLETTAGPQPLAHIYQFLKLLFGRQVAAETARRVIVPEDSGLVGRFPQGTARQADVHPPAIVDSDLCVTASIRVLRGKGSGDGKEQRLLVKWRLVGTTCVRTP